MTNTLHAYGLAHRGCSIGTQPNGFDHFEDVDKAATGFYSVVYYAEELTADQIRDYELTPITEELKTEAPEPVAEEEPKKEAPEKDLTIENEDDLTAMINEEGLLQVAFWMLKGHDNRTLIMWAGIEAGIFTASDLSAFLFLGKMPHYHTFNDWKRRGYIVKKGSKAAFSCRIWDYKTSKAGTYTAEEAAEMNAIMINADGSEVKEGDPKTHSQWYKFTAYFFGLDQVEKINLETVKLPNDCTRRTENGREIIEGNTKEINETLKAAGYTWHKKNRYWFRTIAEPVAEETAEPETTEEVTTPEGLAVGMKFKDSEGNTRTITELTDAMVTFDDGLSSIIDFGTVRTVTAVLTHLGSGAEYIA